MAGRRCHGAGGGGMEFPRSAAPGDTR
jgi:hypothetical protein